MKNIFVYLRLSDNENYVGPLLTKCPGNTHKLNISTEIIFSKDPFSNVGLISSSAIYFHKIYKYMFYKKLKERLCR